MCSLPKASADEMSSSVKVLTMTMGSDVGEGVTNGVGEGVDSAGALSSVQPTSISSKSMEINNIIECFFIIIASCVSSYFYGEHKKLARIFRYRIVTTRDMTSCEIAIYVR